jgi:transcriptional regulator with XRE-family HTH domain
LKEAMMRIDGERLKRLRESRVMERIELAEKSGVSYSTLWALEQAYRTSAKAQTVRKLAEALGVEPVSLVDAYEPAEVS